MPLGEIEDDLVGELSHGWFAAVLHIRFYVFFYVFLNTLFLSLQIYVEIHC